MELLACHYRCGRLFPHEEVTQYTRITANTYSWPEVLDPGEYLIKVTGKFSREEGWLEEIIYAFPVRLE